MPPALTVRTAMAQRTFAPGSDVVVGRDLRADFRVAHLAVSRSHVILRFDQGRWVAVDGSLNGMFVNEQRVSMLDIRDGQRVRLGSPHEGPELTFEITPVNATPPQGPYSMPPRGAAMPVAKPSTDDRQAPSAPRTMAGPLPQGIAQPPSASSATGKMSAPPHPPSAPPRRGPAPSRPPDPPNRRPNRPSHNYVERSTDRLSPMRPGGGHNLAANVARIFRAGDHGPLPPGTFTIGRESDNHIVLADVLASRHHAAVVPTPSGKEIRDLGSINGTFVNGVRVDRAPLGDGDVVTIANIDLVFESGVLVRRRETKAAAATGGLEIHGVTWTIEGNKTLLDNISISARPGSLTAVIGPSGAGKSSFARLVAGYTRPTSGTVAFEGHDIHAEYASLRSRIGMVPQDDVVHDQLTVRQALTYAAELRLPPDTSKHDRAQVVAQIVDELEMTKHLDTRVDKLSGGQRKRASVALELLTGPSLLILDEPTSGLDPALDRQIMRMLRTLADAGRVVLVITHSVTYLQICDHVLLLAPGGKMAFSGPPSEVEQAIGTDNWADIFAIVAEDPDAANQRYREQQVPEPPPPPAQQPGDLGSPARTSLRGQFSTIARRQIRLIFADRGYFIFLALLPFIMGALAITVPGKVGFGIPDAQGDSPVEPATILVLLNVAALFMGTALTIRSLVGERAIFRREQAVGLSTTAYMFGKIFVLGTFAVLQATIVVGITFLGKGTPTQGAVVLLNPAVELWFDVAFTCVGAAMIGLAISALAKSSEQIMPLMVVTIMGQLVLAGGLIPVTNRLVLDQVSWITPARWGFAASASTVDLNKLVVAPSLPKDSHWKHTSSAWTLDILMLFVVSAAYASFVRWRLRLKPL
jgi:ABC transport system ATP-binding/permease protein